MELTPQPQPQVEGTHLCPAINSSRLKPFSQRINRCLMSINEEGCVAMEMIGKTPHNSPDGANIEVTKELVYISPDGLKVQVYQNSEGIPCSGGIPVSGPCKDYIYPNLPSRLWKKYMHAYKFVEVVKSKTPKIVLLTDKAKCKMMENFPVPDFEAHFHQGVRVLLSKDKVHITESNGNSMTLNAGSLNDRVTGKTLGMIEYTTLCQAECHRIYESLTAVQERDNLINMFPVTIGTLHNPFCISQIPLCDTCNDDVISSDHQGLRENQLPLSVNSELPVSSYCDLNSSPAPLSSPMKKTSAVNNPYAFQSQSNSDCDFHSSDHYLNYEKQTINHVPSIPCTVSTLQDCEINSHDLRQTNSPWHLPLECKQFMNVCVRSSNKFDVAENESMREGSHDCQDCHTISQQSSEACMKEVDVSCQSESSVPFSLPCQSENMPSQHLCLSETGFTTPTKCQAISSSHLRQIYSGGCMKTKSHMNESFQHLNNTYQHQESVKRNLFGKNVLWDSKTHTHVQASIQSTQQECFSAANPDILKNCQIGSNPNRVINTLDSNNIPRDAPYIQQQHLSHDTISDVKSMHEQECNQQSPFNSGISSNADEMKQIIHAFEHCNCLSRNSESPSDASVGKNLVNSTQLNSNSNAWHGSCPPSVIKEVLPPHAHFSESSSSFSSESNHESLLTDNVPLQPSQSSSPKKAIRKMAISLGSSMNSKSNSFDLAAIDENHRHSMKAEGNFHTNEDLRGNASGHSSECDSSSFNKHNPSLSSSFDTRKGMNLKHQQDNINATLPYCASPSHSRLLPNFPMSPQKEFLQSDREGQSMDNTLPPLVRNSLDMSVSSYYSDSPSSSPSSSCDPIYQVFVPYTGWASYYAGGAIWVLYNDGTQLGVKATEAVMTFIDQDGTKKKYKNSDVVPDVVKMKLEKLPNVLKIVMKNKNNGNVSQLS